MNERIADLKQLVKGMQPKLAGDFAFCQISLNELEQLEAVPLAAFREAEGVTVLLDIQEAEKHDFPICWVGSQIILEVNSSMDAVGFLAAVCSELANHGIAVNAFSPISHDHLFVHPHEAERALEILQSMSARA